MIKDQSKKEIDRWKVLRRVLITFTIGIVIIRFFTGFDAVPFHGDEVGWSTSGYYYYQLMFIEHDLSPAKWNKQELWEFGMLSMPAGKYLIGMAMHVMLPRGNYFYIYDFSKNEEENRKRGNIPPLDVLKPGRIMSAIVSTLTCVALFWICTLLWNWIVGAVSMLLLAINPLFHLFAQRAMTDSYLILFLVLAVVCCLHLVRLRSSKPILFFGVALLLGFASGLCMSVKLNGAITLIVAAFTLAYLIISDKPRTWKKFRLYSLAGFLAVVSVGGVVITLNPLFHTSSPSELVYNFSYLMGKWRELLEFQQRSFPTQAIIGFPTTALVQLFQEHLSPVLTVAALLGFGSTLMTFDRWQRPANAPLVVFFAASVITLIVILNWLPLDWDRYYLPIVTMVMPFAAYGIFMSGEFIVQHARRIAGLSQSTQAKTKKKLNDRYDTV